MMPITLSRPLEGDLDRLRGEAAQRQMTYTEVGSTFATTAGCSA